MKINPLPPGALVLAFLLAFCPTAFAARTFAAGPNGVDGADLTGNAANHARDLSSVWLGNQGVAVWISGGETDSRYDIVGAKFGAGGQLIGSPVVLLERAIEADLVFRSRSIGLSVAGNELLLVWQNYNEGVLARRMGANLNWLDAVPAVLIPRGDSGLFYYAVSTAGAADRHAVVLAKEAFTPSFPVSPEITFVRMGLSGEPVKEQFPVITPDTSVILDSTVAAGPGGFLIAWKVEGTDHTQRVLATTAGTSGPSTGPLQTLMPPALLNGEYPHPFQISAVPFGGGYAVAWVQTLYPFSGDPPLFARIWRRLDATGTPLEEAKELFSNSPGFPSNFFSAPGINLQAANGEIVAFSSEPVQGGVNPVMRVVRQVVSPGGGLGTVEAFGEPQAMAPESIRIHATGGGLVSVCQANSPAYYSYHWATVAAPLTPNLTLGQPPRLLSPGIPEQQACTVACRGTDYLVVWQDLRDGHSLASEIRGRLFSLDGVPLGSSFRISNSVTEDISPAVAASGGKYLVVWTVNALVNDDDDVWAAMVTAGGTVSAPFPVANLPERQDNGVTVAGGPGGGFFAAWRGGGPASLNQDDIFGTWIDAGGTVTLPNGFEISSTPGKERAVSVAGGADTYGIVWRVGGNNHSDVFGTVVPGSPTAPPSAPAREAFTLNNNAHAPEIAWNGSHYRVIWRDQFNGFHIKSAPMTKEGAVGAAITLEESTEFLFEPAIVSNGSGWQVFWHQMITRLNPAVSFRNECRVTFASLDAGGQVLNEDAFAPRYLDSNTLAAASAPDSGVFIVYPTAREKGKEVRRTGWLESILFRPNRPPADPWITIESNPVTTTLRWKADPWFPRDAGIPETSTDLFFWNAVLQSPFLIDVQGTGDEAVMSFPTIPGTHRFFRLNQIVPGPP